MQAHGNKRKNWCEFQSSQCLKDYLYVLPSLCRYVMITGDSSLVVDAKHRKAAYPISVKDTMLRIFQMLGSILLKATTISCEVFEVADSFYNSY
ncbi:hypothetical protein CDL15_Pgr000017 [Punica granatum]|uniref:Uncharacterized protein n=1 Tax=Punica granatum TaxID=22663 RepID=A0A218VQW5_PUNGR|nr:hypothetical protein CDL15_Pgr000017 [Punica granatum]